MLCMRGCGEMLDICSFWITLHWGELETRKTKQLRDLIVISNFVINLKVFRFLALALRALEIIDFVISIAARNFYI